MSRRGVLVRWRFLFLLACGLPALLSAVQGLSSGAGRQAYYVGAGTLPLMRTARLLGGRSSSLVPAAIFGVVTAIVLDLLLTAGALSVIGEDPPQRRGIRFILRAGATHLAPFLRILFVTMVVMGMGAGLIGLLFHRIDIHAERAHWSGQWLYLGLPILQAMATLLWMAISGGFALVCRAITVADGRRVVRRTAVLALRVCVRQPLRAWMMFAIATLLLEAISGWVMMAWKLPYAGAGQALVRVVLWMVMLLGQALVWRWLIGMARAVYVEVRNEGLRQVPDEGYQLFSRIVRRNRDKIRP